MTFETALKSKIEATPALTALVGSRIYPDVAPQEETGDCLVYQLSNRADPPPVGGTTNGLVRDAVDLTAVSRNRENAGLIRDAVVGSFNGLAARGVWGGEGGLNVRSCVCESAGADHHPAADASETSDRLGRVTLNVFWAR